MPGVDAHYKRVREAFDALGVTWAAWPQAVLDPRLDPEVRLSAVLVLLAGTGDDHAPEDDVIVRVVGEEDPGLDLMGRHRTPWEQLPHLRLPWTAPTATTAVESVSGGWSYDDRRVTLALRGAGQVCAAGHADAALLDALAACTAFLDVVGDEQYRIKDLRSHVRRVVASASHPELLDLSLLVDGDSWAGPAREAARAAPAEAVAPLVRLLGCLGPGKPSARWLREVEATLRTPAARAVLKSWIVLAAEAEVVPEWPGGDLADCPGTLFVHTNTDVVRAAAWATSRLTDEDWPLQALETLARRGAGHNGLAGFPQALSLKVATAAVEVLIARGGAPEQRVLGTLLQDLTRRELLRKIGKALDRQEEVKAREVELVAERAREQRRRANLTTPKARSAMDSLLRAHFGPTLRERGFTGGPRTWRRVQARSSGRDPPQRRA